MKTKKHIRIISRLDIKNNFVIKGKYYEGLRKIGRPIDFSQRYYDEGIDEIIFIDAIASLYDRNALTSIIKKVSKNIYVPLTVGGGIRSIKDIEIALKNGADKISINSHAVRNPSFLAEAIKEFGSSTIVYSVVQNYIDKKKWEIFIDNGRHSTGLDAIEWVKKIIDFGIGEILLNSIEKDGIMNGFDLSFINEICKFSNVPIICSSGAGNLKHLSGLLSETDCDAICIGSAFHYNFLNIKQVKKFLKNKGYKIR